MKYLITIMTLVTSMHVQAAPNLFQRINDLFISGQKPTLENWSGHSIAGRCFYASAPDTPVAAYFNYRVDYVDAGPIQDPTKIYYGFAFMSKKVAANHYDNLDKHDTKLVYRLGYADETLALKYNDGYIMGFRQNGDYIVSIAFKNTNKIDVACYFFKKK